MRSSGRHLLIIAALCLAAAEASATRFLLFPFNPELSLFVQGYHHRPDPEAAVDRFFTIDIEGFERNASTAQQPHSRAVLMAFYVNIVHSKPELVMPFAERLVATTTGAKAAFGSEIIAHGATLHRAEALALVAKGFRLAPGHQASLANLESFPYPKMTADNWQMLDILWACFFASGDAAYLRAILEPLNNHAVPAETWMQRTEELSKNPPPPDTPEHTEWIGLLTARAALFGITLNAAHYPAVLEQLRAVQVEPTRSGELSRTIVLNIQNRVTAP